MKFGVVVFPGSNCDMDIVYVLETILEQEVVKLWHKDTNLKECDFIILPGGFSFGDYLRSGAIAKLTTSNDSGVIPEPGFMTTIVEKVTGFAGGYSESSIEGVQSLVSYTSVFTQVGVVAIGMAVLAFLLSPILKKWMHGVH